MKSLAYLELGSANGGVILDLSEGGLALSAASQLILDKVLPMRFELPTIHEPIEARGRVVWLGESKKTAGIKFEELSDDALRKIRKWISTQQSANGEYSAPERKTLEPISVPDPAEPHEEASVASHWFAPRANPGSTEQQPSTTALPQSLEKPIETTMCAGHAERSVQPMGGVSTAPSRKGVNPRAHRRQSVSPLVAYVDLGPGNGGMVLNISEGGLALTAAARLAGDQVLRLRFELPNLQGWIEAHGRIAWLSESKKEAGVKFEELSAGALTRIKDWIATRLGNEQAREGAAQEVEWIGAAEPATPHQKPIHRTAVARDRILGGRPQPRNIAIPNAAREASAAPFPIPLAASEEPESRLERSRQGRGGQTPERKWIGLAAIIVVVALISFATGLLIERHLNQGSAEGEMADIVSQAHDMKAPSSTPAPDAASGTPAHADIGSVAGSPEASSTSDSLPLESEVLGTNAAPTGRRDQHARNTTNLRKKPEPRAYERKHSSAAANPPVVEANKSRSAALPPATLPHPTDATQATSPAREAVPPQIKDTTPRGAPAVASQVAPSLNGNQTKNLPPPREVTANSVSPSVSITMPPFPSLRVPAELRSHASRPGTSLQMGQLASRVEPAYPSEAVRQRIEGTVKLHAIIGRDGAVQSVVAVGPPLLGEAATSAVRQWRYKPTVLGGQAVEAEQDIVVVFHLSASASGSN